MRPLRKSTTFSSFNHVKSRDVASQERSESSEDGFEQLSAALKEHDMKMIEGCREDIDTLLVFAGLFSAVVTAMNVEGYKTLQRDSGDLSSTVLLHISQQLADMSDGPKSPPVNLTGGAYIVPAFKPSTSAVRINILWFASLVFSLIAASLSMLVKQWLREYLAGQPGTPEEYIRVRHYRYEGLVRWRVFDIVALLPLLLHIALILFFIGLGDFLVSLDITVGGVVSSLIGTWLFAYAASIIVPAIIPDCPYVTPLTKPGIRTFRLSIWKLWCRCRSYFDIPPPTLHKYYSYPGDEVGVRRNARFDLPALNKADQTFTDDTFLDIVIRPCLRRFNGPETFEFTQQVLTRRLHRETTLKLSLDASIDFKQLSTKAILATMEILLQSLNHVLSSPQGPVGLMQLWAQKSLCFLMKAAEHLQVARAAGPTVWEGFPPILLALLTCQERHATITALVFLSQYSMLLPLLGLRGQNIEPAAFSNILNTMHRLIDQAIEPSEIISRQADQTLGGTQAQRGALPQRPREEVIHNAVIYTKVKPVDICKTTLFLTHSWVDAYYRFHSAGNLASDLPFGLLTSVLHRLSHAMGQEYFSRPRAFDADYNETIYFCQYMLDSLMHMVPGSNIPQWASLRSVLVRAAPDPSSLQVMPWPVPQSPAMPSHTISASPLSMVDRALETPVLGQSDYDMVGHMDTSTTVYATASGSFDAQSIVIPEFICHTEDAEGTQQQPPGPPDWENLLKSQSIKFLDRPVQLFHSSAPRVPEEEVSKVTEELMIESNLPMAVWRKCIEDIRDSWEQHACLDIEHSILSKWNDFLVWRGMKLEVVPESSNAQDQEQSHSAWSVYVVPVWHFPTKNGNMDRQGSPGSETADGTGLDLTLIDQTRLRWRALRVQSIEDESPPELLFPRPGVRRIVSQRSATH